MQSIEKKSLILEDLWGIYKLPESIHTTACECKCMFGKRNFSGEMVCRLYNVLICVDYIMKRKAMDLCYAFHHPTQHMLPFACWGTKPLYSLLVSKYSDI